MDKKKAKSSYSDCKKAAMKYMATDTASDCNTIRNCSMNAHESSSNCSKNKASNKATDCSK